jgi:hypothetical protein
MKRSEMINILQDAIINHTIDGIYLPDYVCSTILEVLEEAGMRPQCNANFGGHGKLDVNNECDDYIESCSFRWDEE